MIYGTSRDKALPVAERIREGFALAAKEVEGRPLTATVSIGLAYCDQPMLDVPEMLTQSDQALYFAKEWGRNRVEVASRGDGDGPQGRRRGRIRAAGSRRLGQYRGRLTDP